MRHDLPSWHAVYDQAQRWLRAGCFESLVHDLHSVLRLASRRVARTFYPRHLGRPRFWPHGRPIVAAVASEMAFIFKPSMLHDAATLRRSAIEDLSPHAPPISHSGPLCADAGGRHRLLRPLGGRSACTRLDGGRAVRVTPRVRDGAD